MLVNEIINESEQLDEISRPDYMEASSILRKNGWKISGEGHYSQVYENPKYPYVLKLFANEDIGYKNFVELVRKTKNIHFPIFRGKLMRINSQYSAIRMEKLAALKGNDRNLAELIENYIGSLRHVNKINRFMDEMEELEMSQPGIIEACNMLRKYYNDFLMHSSYHVNIDIHPENIMKRGNTLVIIDPFS